MTRLVAVPASNIAAQVSALDLRQYGSKKVGCWRAKSGEEVPFQLNEIWNERSESGLIDQQ